MEIDCVEVPDRRRRGLNREGGGVQVQPSYPSRNFQRHSRLVATSRQVHTGDIERGDNDNDDSGMDKLEMGRVGVSAGDRSPSIQFTSRSPATSATTVGMEEIPELPRIRTTVVGFSDSWLEF